MSIDRWLLVSPEERQERELSSELRSLGGDPVAALREAIEARRFILDAIALKVGEAAKSAFGVDRKKGSPTGIPGAPLDLMAHLDNLTALRTYEALRLLARSMRSPGAPSLEDAPGWLTQIEVRGLELDPAAVERVEREWRRPPKSELLAASWGVSLSEDEQWGLMQETGVAPKTMTLRMARKKRSNLWRSNHLSPKKPA